MVNKRKLYIVINLIVLLQLFYFTNSNIIFVNFNEKESKFDNLTTSNNSDSPLFENFYYLWHSFINGNPFQYYNGVENYTYLGSNIYRCNETIQYGIGEPSYDIRDVNNETRLFPSSTYWGNNGHDWVWIFRNTTLSSKNIPISVYTGPAPESLFNVTGETSIDLYGTIYNVWILEDDRGSIVYYEKNTGILIKGLFYFSGLNSWEINMTGTNADIPLNDNPPTLENPFLNPTYGNLTTIFTFAINYSDANNNKPSEIGVVINGTYYNMTKQNPSDINYVDGVIYEKKTFLLNGTYNYYFNTSDGRYSVSTGLYFGPTVYYNNSYPPVLSDPSVYPLLGYNSSTEFNYKVIYSDTDNNNPIFVNITINGTIYSMEKENLLDHNYMDGCIYSFKTILNETGNYVYNFTSSDGENLVTLPNMGFYYNPNITRNSLDHINIGWIRTHGEDSNSTYTTFLNDAITLGATSEEYHQKISPFLLYPYELFILEEGGDPWLEYELINLKYWIENGGSLIIIGDNMEDAQVSLNNIFNVSYNSQVLAAGSSTQVYQPHYLTSEVSSLNFGNPSAFINTSLSTNNLQIIANTSDGYPQIAFLGFGRGKILWIADEIVEDSQILGNDNRILGLNSLRWMSEKMNNKYIPTLTNPGVTPLTGNTSTIYTFTVNYTDMDNRGPIYMNLTINQTSYQMVKQNPLDFNYKDGVIFQYITTLQRGTYHFFFNSSDGENNVSTSIIPGPNVNYINEFDPQLNLGIVTPNTGYENQIFTFRVNYSDADNNEPKFVNVIIDTIPYLMEKQDSSDNYYIDGVIYEYKTLLNVGLHAYYFNASDEERSVSTILSLGPNVFRSPVKNMRIAWITSHGENTNASYNNMISDVISLGAYFEIFSQEINESSLQDYDLLVIAEGGASWTFSELKALRNWVANGNSILILGDNRDPAQISVSSQFKIFYSDQPGISGNSIHLFRPHNLTNGVSTIFFPGPASSISTSSNIYLTPLVKDNNEKLIIASLLYGSGKLLCVVDDCFSDLYINQMDNNLFCNNTWKWLSDTSSNLNSPVINNVNVSPSSGNSLTVFKFYLNYTDPDDSAPTFVNIIIDGIVYEMTKQIITDFNFDDGILFNFSIQLTTGIHYYYYNVSDGKFPIRFPVGQLELHVSPVSREEDGTLILIITIISVSSAVVATLGIVIYVIRRKRTKNLNLIDRIVDDIQDNKSKK